jgi:predicted NAD/FAD-binding protein
LSERQANMRKSKVAVVGSGISGLSAAWLLAHDYAVTVFEAQDRLGGHSHTVDITLDGVTAPVDTDFLVFNDRTYPNLMALLRHLGVADAPSTIARAFLRYPWMTLGVILRIHSQALRLWLKGVAFFRKPLPPVQENTR